MIIVVGGRVSGATLAGLLASQGENVLIVEKRPVISPTISIALICPDALAIFDRIGFGAVLDQAHFPKITHLSFEVLPGVRVSGRLPASHGRDWAYAMRREKLDHLLFEHLRRTFRNIEVRDTFAVTQLVLRNDSVVGVQGHVSNGGEEAIYGDLVVGADGKSSIVARLVRASQYDSRDVRTSFYYSYFKGVEPAYSEPSLVTYQGAIPFPVEVFSSDADDGLTGIGVQAPQHAFRAFRHDPGGMIAQCVNGIAVLSDRMRHAVRVTRVMGMLIPAMYKRIPFGPGWALVGDASIYFNPITGQGLGFACKGSVWLSDAIRSWRMGIPFDQAMHNYQVTRDHFSFHNYDRAASVSNIGESLEPWRKHWYKWMSEQPAYVEEWLAMLSNALPPEVFFSADRTSAAKMRFGV